MLIAGIGMLTALGMLNSYFVSFWASFNFVFFSLIFTIIFDLFKFLFGFLVFLSNCIFSHMGHGTPPETCIWLSSVIGMRAR